MLNLSEDPRIEDIPKYAAEMFVDHGEVFAYQQVGLKSIFPCDGENNRNVFRERPERRIEILERLVIKPSCVKNISVGVDKRKNFPMRIFIINQVPRAIRNEQVTADDVARRPLRAQRFSVSIDCMFDILENDVAQSSFPNERPNRREMPLLFFLEKMLRWLLSLLVHFGKYLANDRCCLRDTESFSRNEVIE